MYSYLFKEEYEQGAKEATGLIASTINCGKGATGAGALRKGIGVISIG
jgi:hypothetical protein